MKLDFEAMPDHARVWVYQCSRVLTQTEIEQIQGRLDFFVQGWAAHGQPLMSSYSIEHGRFLVFAVDEKASGVTGCSIDSSVSLVKEFCNDYKVDFFDRMAIAWIKADVIQITPMHEFWAMRKAGIITDVTLVYDNLVKAKGDLAEAWLVPFSQSWHAKMW
ncbi:MAG: hypothetical protein ACI9RU_001097 [Litorivivens sp.]|jgi:hypothetical protein